MALRYSDVAVPLAEKALIQAIRRMAENQGGSRGKSAKKTGAGHGGERDRSKSRKTDHPSSVITGIGDDCAILRPPPGHEILITTDFSIEGVHFRRDWHPAGSVGHRCLARGLSDIAAMGGEPVAAFLSLGLPGDVAQSWVREFLRGMLKLGGSFGVTLAGGDTAESPDGIVADIIVVGSVPRGKSVLRSGAKPGDRIYASGELGGSAAAVRELKGDKKLNPSDYSRHFFPAPRVELGRILREKGMASAMIDLSDGLSTDLAHICDESGVGAQLEANSIPLATVGKDGHEVDLELALHGGEDYELLFTASRSKRIPSQIAGVPITLIGHITRVRKVVLMDRHGSGYELRPEGWEHFRSQGSDGA